MCDIVLFTIFGFCWWFQIDILAGTQRWQIVAQTCRCAPSFAITVHTRMSRLNNSFKPLYTQTLQTVLICIVWCEYLSVNAFEILFAWSTRRRYTGTKNVDGKHLLSNSLRQMVNFKYQYHFSFKYNYEKRICMNLYIYIYIIRLGG